MPSGDTRGGFSSTQSTPRGRTTSANAPIEVRAPSQEDASEDKLEEKSFQAIASRVGWKACLRDLAGRKRRIEFRRIEEFPCFYV